MRTALVWVIALAAALPLAAAEPADVRAIAEKVDQLVAARWTKSDSTPAPLADDAEFLRRAYLDLAGRIPTVPEARSFLGDDRGDKRARLVDHLLGSPRYVTHFTNVWRDLLIPEAGTNFQVKLQQGGFETWLRQQVAKNAGYDAMTRDLLTPPVGSAGPAALALLNANGPSPLTWYLSKEFRPENLAAGTARVFLGVKVECAQCHNHPFAEWKREQFWGFAAFFAGIKSQQQMDFLVPAAEDKTKRDIAMPGTEKVIKARFLDGGEPPFKDGTATRATLADWVTSPTNPYFARAAVNRTWASLLGTGLVEPVDEMVGADTKLNNPEVLDLLSRELVAHKFDPKFLLRVITATRAYQLSSVKTHSSQDDPSKFARMPLRGMTGEQLFDSVATATGYRDSGGGDDLISGLVGGNRSARSEFLTRFALSERATEAKTSILQALTLMNGKVVASATSLERSETLTAVVDAPFADAGERVEALYLATLARKPTAKELDRALRFVKSATDTREALADVFWALLNGPEFILNH